MRWPPSDKYSCPPSISLSLISIRYNAMDKHLKIEVSDECYSVRWGKVTIFFLPYVRKAGVRYPPLPKSWGTPTVPPYPLESYTYAWKTRVRKKCCIYRNDYNRLSSEWTSIFLLIAGKRPVFGLQQFRSFHPRWNQTIYWPIGKLKI